MKKTIFALGAALILAAPVALAADNDHNKPHGQHGNQNNDNDHDNDHDGDHDGNNHGNNNDNNHRDRTRVNVHIGTHGNVRVGGRAGWVKFNANIRAPRRFHWKAYHRPAGWYAHHWRFHERLPRAFFVRDYWIDDYGQFGLLAPEEGLVWVRVGSDACLIDPETGEIVRVVYGVFY